MTRGVQRLQREGTAYGGDVGWERGVLEAEPSQREGVGVHRAVRRGGAHSVPASRWVRSLWWDSAEDCFQLELEFSVCLYSLLSLGRWQPK